jgi:hypothetical protein
MLENPEAKAGKAENASEGYDYMRFSNPLSLIII